MNINYFNDTLDDPNLLLSVKLENEIYFKYNNIWCMIDITNDIIEVSVCADDIFSSRKHITIKQPKIEYL